MMATFALALIRRTSMIVLARSSTTRAVPIAKSREVQLMTRFERVVTFGLGGGMGV